MIKKLLIIVVPLLLISIILIYTILKVNTFYLEDEYYEGNAFIEIDSDTFNELESNEESFVIFICQQSCSTSNEFEVLLTEFMEENNIIIYKMNFSEIENTSISDDLEYYPSVMLYKNGSLVTNLDAAKDSHIKYYENIDDFSIWFYKYVLEKKNS